MRKRDEESHVAYTKQRNKVRKQAEKERERKIAQKVKTNPKKFWNYVAARTKPDKEYLSLKSQTQQTAKENRQGQNRTKRKVM